jgi:hypothetical protein
VTRYHLSWVERDAFSRPEAVEAGLFPVYFLVMQNWLITPEEKIVVAFDICSSTTIVEDLTLTNNVGKLLDVLDASDVGCGQCSTTYHFHPKSS